MKQSSIKHGTNLPQSQSVKTLSNDELVRFYLEDPISGTGGNQLSLTGGHHRTTPDTMIRILVHD